MSPYAFFFFLKTLKGRELYCIEAIQAATDSISKEEFRGAYLQWQDRCVDGQVILKIFSCYLCSTSSVWFHSRQTLYDGYNCM